MRSTKAKKKLIIAIIAGLCAALTVLNAFNSMNEKMKMQQEQIAKQSSLILELRQNMGAGSSITLGTNRQQGYVVAAKEIASGTKITEDMLEITSSDVQTENTFPDKLAVVGKIALKTIYKGQMIRISDVMESEFSRNRLAAGMRAITIPVSNIQGLASYIKVGTHVDVLSTAKTKDSEPGLILQNVKIVSLEAPQGAKDDTIVSALNASGVTLEIPASASVRLVNAMQDGKLLFVTRGANDQNIVPVTRKRVKTSSNTSNIPANLPNLPQISSIGTLSDKSDDLPAPAKPSAAPQAKVEMIQAGVRSEVTFGGG